MRHLSCDPKTLLAEKPQRAQITSRNRVAIKAVEAQGYGQRVGPGARSFSLCIMIHNEK